MLPERIDIFLHSTETTTRTKKKKVLPGIEPGLPEDTEEIRIRSDNRYLGGISYLD